MPQLAQRFINHIICGDARRILQQLPAESIDCVVTSPPYWSLRDYGVKGQIGLEPSFPDYLTKLCDIFDEVKRVLKGEGTCWVNLGDTHFGDAPIRQTPAEPFSAKHQADQVERRRSVRLTDGVVKKSLVQIPARFALEISRRGWILRNEIIWHKPNSMPSSATDRFTVDFEKLFFFVQSRRYYFAQQFEALRDPARLRRRPGTPLGQQKRQYGDPYIAAINPQTAEASRLRILERGRNKRCVWSIATSSFRGHHFAVYPPQLIETPIQAGCPKGGVVLDPFIGSGTTAVVASQLGRKFIGIDLNPQYVQLAEQRLAASH